MCIRDRNGSISGKNKDIKAIIIRLKKILNIKEFDSSSNSISKFKPLMKLYDRADIILVFSFGYFNEIVHEVSTKMSYSEDNFISILDLIKE